MSLEKIMWSKIVPEDLYHKAEQDIDYLHHQRVFTKEHYKTRTLFGPTPFKTTYSSKQIPTNDGIEYYLTVTYDVSRSDDR